MEAISGKKRILGLDKISAFILPKDGQGHMPYQNSHTGRNGMTPVRTYSVMLQPHKMDPDGSWRFQRDIISHPLFKEDSLNRK